MRRRDAVLICCLVATLSATALAAQTGFVVVVSEANAAESMSRAELAKIFLKKTCAWEGGLAAQPIDQKQARPVRGAFTRSVFGKSVPAVKAYWQKMIFTGRGVPPRELDSDSKVIAFVRENPGAVAYVSSGTTLGEGIKVLRLTDGGQPR